MLKPLSLFVKYDGASSRSPMTCRYRCGDQCGHEPPNPTDNTYFRDVARAAIGRRQMLRGSAMAVLAIGAGSTLAACSDDAEAAGVLGSLDSNGVPRGTDFQPVAPNSQDALVVPPGYEQQVVIRWGDKVLPDAPKWDPFAQTAAAQEKQFGFNNDFAALLPVPGNAKAYLLVANHEYTTEEHMLPGYDVENPSDEHIDIGLAAHGLSVVEVREENGRLVPHLGKYNRRIHGKTEFEVRGVAAGSRYLKTSDDQTGKKVLGTFNNCSGGVTPWGTILSGEENFHQYFKNASKVADPVVAARLKRYAVTDKGHLRHWGNKYARFDLAAEPNEVNRFGWVIEIDPWNASSTPIKHTAMGRFKHEAANIWVTDDGTVVSYLGDDERFEYIYKFVSSRKMMSGQSPSATAHNMGILDYGTLYVAQLSGNEPQGIDGSDKAPPAGGFDGVGNWVPLLTTNEDGTARSHIDGMDPQEVAVFTRLAADKAKATKMDRPEDFEPNPKTGKVYAALTNNSNRGLPEYAGADEANPRNENKDGHVIEIDDDHAGRAFTWNLLLVCGDPNKAITYYGGFDKSAVSPISCPDNLAFDPHGNLWIATDGNAFKSNDGLFSVVLDGPNRGETKQFLTVPYGAETCGPIVTGDRVMVCVQHPGEIDGATAEKPAAHWPDGGTAVPRPAVVNVFKPGGSIGV